MSVRMRLAASFCAALLSAAIFFSQAACAQMDAKSPVIVFAAASLKNALDKLTADWQQEFGPNRKDELRREFHAGKADGGGRACTDLYFRRPRLDGLRGGERAHQAGKPFGASRE